MSKDDMSVARLSVYEASVLLVLMAEAREISNPELKERYGLDLVGKNRENLNKLMFVDSKKKGRAYVHVLREEGWAWCNGELYAAGPPPGSGRPGGALYAMLAGLRRYLERSDLSLTDVFSPTDDAGEPQPTVEETASPVPSDLDVDLDVEARIRDAYASLAAAPGVWVNLAELRLLLGDVEKAHVDDTLRRMNRLPDIAIVSESNQKTLTEEERQAAVIIGNQDKHLLSIGLL